MLQTFFNELFREIEIPVVICKNNDEKSVLFLNRKAYLMLNPPYALRSIESNSSEKISVEKMIHFENTGEWSCIWEIIKNKRNMNFYSTKILPDGKNSISVKITANTVNYKGNECIVFYLLPEEEKQEKDEENMERLFSILNISYHSVDVEETIKNIISIAGEYMDVSRVYIFEDIKNYARNTYEWCAPGISAQMDNLQNLCQDDYNYDMIVNSPGIYAIRDISELPERERFILEPQGIKALAILPLYYMDKPIGYVGYDDCQKARDWTPRELYFLQSITSIITSLINRRDAEAEARRGHEILQTITDNMDAAVYVNDLNTYKLKFVNRALAEAYGAEPEELIGQVCYKSLQKGFDEPCPFCPIPKLLERMKKGENQDYQWEFKNTRTEQWYWIKDSIITWVDGKMVHFESAVDITLRKNYEDQLKHFATVDAMTGILNREWGYKKLVMAKENSSMDGQQTLCFIDLDKLKQTNDTLGHDAGDELILTVVETIREKIGRETMFCRWGGDEFLLLMPYNEEKARFILDSALAELKKLKTRNDFSFSYGVVDFNKESNIDALVTEADRRMYENKIAKKKDK